MYNIYMFMYIDRFRRCQWSIMFRLFSVGRGHVIIATRYIYIYVFI